LRAEILAPIRRLAGGRIFFAQNPSGGDRSKAIRRKSKVIRRGSGQKIFVCVPAVKTCPAVGGQRAAIEARAGASRLILIDLIDLSPDQPQHAQRESQFFCQIAAFLFVIRTLSRYIFYIRNPYGIQTHTQTRNAGMQKIQKPNWPFPYKNDDVFSKLILSHDALQDISYHNDESPSMGVVADDLLGDAAPCKGWTPIQIFVDDNDPAVAGDDANFHRGKISVKITYDPVHLGTRYERDEWFTFDGTDPADVEEVIALVRFHISALKDHCDKIRPFAVQAIWPHNILEYSMWDILKTVNEQQLDGFSPYHADWKEAWNEWVAVESDYKLIADLSDEAGLDAWLAHKIETDLADKPDPDWGGVFGMFFASKDLPMNYSKAVELYEDAVGYGDYINETDAEEN
jgi:hypothetical protein